MSEFKSLEGADPRDVWRHPEDYGLDRDDPRRLGACLKPWPKRERKPPGPSNVTLARWAVSGAIGYGPALRVLVVMWTIHARPWDQGGAPRAEAECWPSSRQLADRLGVSPATIRRALDVLQRAGAVERCWTAADRKGWRLLPCPHDGPVLPDEVVRLGQPGGALSKQPADRDVYQGPRFTVPSPDRVERFVSELDMHAPEGAPSILEGLTPEGIGEWSKWLHQDGEVTIMADLKRVAAHIERKPHKIEQWPNGHQPLRCRPFARLLARRAGR